MNLEICIDSLESAKNAISAGANRLEICNSLDLDGISPSVGLVSLISKYKDIEKFVMVRPRPYDFCYSDDEFEVMKEEIRLFKNFDIDGFVLGILKPDGRIDLRRTKILVDLAKPLKVVFHRAFDYSLDGFEQIPSLIDMGLVRILTSGKKAKAYEGIDLLKKINETYGDRIEIMVGSGVDPNNIGFFYKQAHINSFHMSASSMVKSKMDYLKGHSLYKDIRLADKSLIERSRQAIDKLE
ncbi:MAG: copper homeostasis protein CutC [Anaerococcus sp.]|nr:copper homeostasis protein CutC [Anaerococcus sp.]